MRVWTRDWSEIGASRGLGLDDIIIYILMRLIVLK